MRRGRELAPGNTFDGRYTIERVIGGGTSSTVYQAVDMGEERPVALKLFTNRNIPQARIDREVTIHSNLNHPNIIQFHRYSETAAFPYIDMELARASFHRALGSPRLSFKNAVAFMALTSDAVNYAHNQGYFHRDLKPASLLYTGTVKIGDWGVGLPITSDKPRYLSLQDRIEGTPTYIAPEQVLGRPSPASDIYVLGGLVAYEAFTGRQAVGQITWYDAMARQLITSPPPFERVLKGDMTDIYAAVEVPIRRALAKRPSDRQANMAEYRAELIEAYRKGQEKQTRQQTIIDLNEE